MRQHGITGGQEEVTGGGGGWGSSPPLFLSLPPWARSQPCTCPITTWLTQRGGRTKVP